VIGAVLAGGAGSRLGQGKATASLGGRPLIAYPLAALAGVCERVAVVCKSSTELPDLAGVERWDEPDEPRHPLAGIVHALEVAEAPVLVCAVDMPFLTADALRSLLQATADSAAVVATAAGKLQPVLGLYAPAALPALRDAPPDAPLTRTIETLDPVRVALPAPLVASVNTPDELAEAEARLARAAG
jgi:molybdopterin-guanine dinucleotide biosynthesis protein A